MRGIATPKATQRRIRRRWWWLIGIMAFLAVPYLIAEPAPEDRARLEARPADAAVANVQVPLAEQTQQEDRQAAAAEPEIPPDLPPQRRATAPREDRPERPKAAAAKQQEQERAAAAQKAARATFVGKLRGMPLVGAAHWTKRGDLYLYTTAHGTKEEWRKLVLTVCRVAAARGIRDFNVLVLDYEFARLGEFKSRASKLCG